MDLSKYSPYELQRRQGRTRAFFTATVPGIGWSQLTLYALRGDAHLKDYVLLSDLYTSPGLARQGIARSFIQMALGICTVNNWNCLIYAHAHGRRDGPTNEALSQFYKELGFQDFNEHGVMIYVPPF